MGDLYTPLSAVSGGKKNLKMIVCVAHIWCDAFAYLVIYAFDHTFF